MFIHRLDICNENESTIFIVHLDLDLELNHAIQLSMLAQCRQGNLNNEQTYRDEN